MKTTTIAQLFEAVTLAIMNTSSHEEIQQKLNKYGLTPKRMQEGSSLLEQAQSSNQMQEQYYDATRRISVQIGDESKHVLELFKEHVSIAKTAFIKEPHILKELKIKSMADNNWPRIQQALGFYQKATFHMEKLVQYGAVEDTFNQNMASVEALIALKRQRMKQKGDAENSTQEKNQSIKALRSWYSEFRKLARIAFKDNPQVLESFGIVVSTAKKKQKENTASA